MHFLIVIGILLSAAPSIAADKNADWAVGGVLTGVAHPIDGDTLFVETANGAMIRTRLFGQNSFEYDTAEGWRASAALTDLAEGRQVACDIVDRNRPRRKGGTGRPVAVCALVEGDGRRVDLAEAMLLTGEASAARYFLFKSYPKADPAVLDGLAARYLAAEAQARKAGLGVWGRLARKSADDAPPPPRPVFLWMAAALALFAFPLGFLGAAAGGVWSARRHRLAETRMTL